MKRRKLNIDPALIEYAEMVLKRDGMPYCIDEDGSLVAYLDEEEEEILIEDAMCEEQRMRENPDMPVYSFRTQNDTKKIIRLQRLFYGMNAKDKDMPYRELEKDADAHIEFWDRNGIEHGCEPMDKETKKWLKSCVGIYDEDELNDFEPESDEEDYMEDLEDIEDFITMEDIEEALKDLHEA